MKDKTPLLLMEQLMMILVFALAAAVCLKAFALSHELSRESEARDRAVTVAQNAAELMKNHGGEAESALEAVAEEFGGDKLNGTHYVNYAADWTRTDAEAVYRLEVEAADTAPGLSGAEVRVLECGEEGAEPLISLTVLWQEVPYEG